MALHLHQLKKNYVGPDGSVVPVVDIDSFDLPDGEQSALIGTSGSGKTTLLHLIAGILTPDSGRILFGRDTEIAPTAVLAAVSPATATAPVSDVVDYRTAAP